MYLYIYIANTSHNRNAYYKGNAWNRKSCGQRLLIHDFILPVLFLYLLSCFIPHFMFPTKGMHDTILFLYFLSCFIPHFIFPTKGMHEMVSSGLGSYLFILTVWFLYFLSCFIPHFIIPTILNFVFFMFYSTNYISYKRNAWNRKQCYPVGRATYSYLQFYRLCSSYTPHIFVLFQGTT